MSTVHFLMLDHTDEHAAHAAIRKHGIKTAHGRLHLVATSPEQWGKTAMHAITTDQGFTAHDHIGDAPKAGYMVSLAKDSEKVFAIADITPADIVDYRQAHASALAERDNYLGAWVYEGNVYLDVSCHESALEPAMDKAKARSQLGVYDIAKGSTIDTADYFSERKAASLSSRHGLISHKVFWTDQANDLAVINGFRAQAGLPPVAHDTTSAIAKRALRLVTGRE